MPRIFVSSTLVDRWLAEGRARLDGDVLCIEAPESRAFLHLDPAVHFECVDGPHPDKHELVGAIRSAADLGSMGAEHFDTSVVYREEAYTVQPGFTAVPMEADGTQLVMSAPAWQQLVATLLRMSSDLPAAP